MWIQLIDRDRSVTVYPFNISLKGDFTHQAATLELGYSWGYTGKTLNQSKNHD